MKTVGIKKLKNELSQYLQLVKEGEILLVTDRDEVIAEILQPSLPTSTSFNRWDAFLAQQERTGQLRRAQRKQSTALTQLEELNKLNKKYLSNKTTSIQTILNEVRSDRFLNGKLG